VELVGPGQPTVKNGKRPWYVGWDSLRASLLGGLVPSICFCWLALSAPHRLGIARNVVYWAFVALAVLYVGYAISSTVWWLRHRPQKRESFADPIAAWDRAQSS